MYLWINQNGVLVLMAKFARVDMHYFTYRRTRKLSITAEKNMGFGDGVTLKKPRFRLISDAATTLQFVDCFDYEGYFSSSFVDRPL